MKGLFQGKRKLISIPILAIIALVFLPIAIGLGLGYLVYKKVGNTKAKYALLAVLALFILPVGSAWVAGMTSPSKAPAVQNQVASKTENIQVSPTSAVQATPTPDNTNKQEAKVVKVVDGDTIAVSINGKNETIRIIGINSPETVDPRKPVECFGKKASDMAKEQLSGQTIQLEADPTQGDRDKYSRLLRYVWLDDGSSDFGAIMIQYGYAYEYTYDTPYKYQSKYKQLQKEAEASKKGLWADNACPVTQITTKTSQPTTQPVQQQTTQQNTSGSTSNTYSGGDKDCKDFSTQAEAQAYFNSRGGSASNNVDRLDGSDHDGRVCESLP